MSIKLSQRVQAVKPSPTLAITARAAPLRAAGKDVIGLGAGEPDFDTPPCVKAAACKALEDGHTHYTHSLGLPELRETICHYYREHYGVAISADQIIVTSGTSPAMLLLFAALLDPGDQVIIPRPCWVSFPEQVRLAGGEPVLVLYEEYLRSANPQLLQVLDDGIPGMQLAAGFEFPRVGRVQVWTLDGALGSVAMANTPHSNNTQEITP